MGGRLFAVRQHFKKSQTKLAPILLFGLTLTRSSESVADTLPFDPSQFPDPNSLIDPTFVGAIVKTIGLATDHRSYEPATALGLRGFDFGLDVTASKIPKDFNDAIKKAGLGNFNLPILPIPRLHLYKGVGERFGVGVSYIGFQNYKIYGGDAKLTFFQPEEGPTFALRLAYSKSTIGFVKTSTWNPQLIMSKKLIFADPYLGIGYQLTRGNITVPLEVEGYKIILEGSGEARSFNAFAGIQFNLGLQLTLEGSYSAAGMNTLGVKIGFSL